jgi:hypothetical protein
MKEFTQIHVKNHFRALPFLSINIILSLVGVWFFKFDQSSIIIFSSYLGIITIPVLFIHLEYYLHDRYITIQLTRDEIRISNKKTGVDKILKVQEIKKIIVYQSANMNKIPILPSEFYFYAKVFTQVENDSVIITSLMLSNYAEEFNALGNISREFKGTFLASPTLTIA